MSYKFTELSVPLTDYQLEIMAGLVVAGSKLVVHHQVKGKVRDRHFTVKSVKPADPRFSRFKTLPLDVTLSSDTTGKAWAGIVSFHHKFDCVTADLYKDVKGINERNEALFDDATIL